MSSLLIVNANLVNEGEKFPADVYCKNGRIEEIGAALTHRQADTVIDAKGKLLIPGMIDGQVHFREPGLTQKGDMATESRAAVAGGVTSFMEMPNVNPLTINYQALEDKYARANGRAAANFAFYLGATNDNLDEIQRLPKNTACGIKIFMGASTGDMLVDDEQALEGIFAEASILVATHCEDTPTIKRNEALAREQYGDDVPIAMHPKIRSEEACYLSSSLAVSLAKRFGTKLHVLHLTTAKELELFTSGDVVDKQISLEACVHHLFLSEEDYAKKGNGIKCNPAIKRAEDRAALLAAVNNDIVDVIATDHAPHLAEEKAWPFMQAPAGLPLVQHALPILFEFYADGLMSIETIVKKTSHNVAQRFNVVDRGFIREGYWADLVLIDTARPQLVSADNILYKCAWSPFEGDSFRASVDTTIVNGQLAYQYGRSEPIPALGQRLELSQ